MIVNKQEQFLPSEFLRQIQITETPIRNNIAFVADKNTHIRQDIADLRHKLDSVNTKRHPSPLDKPTPLTHFQYHSGTKPNQYTSNSVHFTPTPHTTIHTQNKKYTVEVPEQSDENFSQLISEVTHYRQENAQLRQILAEKDHSAQQVIAKLHHDIDTLKVEHERVRSLQQRTIKQQHDARKGDSLPATCHKCIQLQLKIKGLQQQLQTETEQYWRGLRAKDEEIAHIQKENNELKRKVSQLKEKDLQNIEEYNQLMQSYRNLNSDNETITLEFDQAIRRQGEQEQQLNDLVARIEDINIRLEGTTTKGEHFDVDTLVAELDHKIGDLQTRLAEKTTESLQLQAKLTQKDDHFHRLTDQYSELIERIERHEYSESIYKHKINELEQQVSKLTHNQVTVNPANEELILKNQHLRNQLQLETNKNKDLGLALNLKEQQIGDLNQRLDEAEGYQNTLRETIQQKDNTIDRLENENEGLQAKIKEMIYVEESHKDREDQFAEELTPSTLRIQLLEAEREDMRNKIYEYEELIAQMQSHNSSDTQQDPPHNHSKQSEPQFQQQTISLRRELSLTRKRIQELEHDLTQEQLSSERANREQERTIASIQNDNTNLINQNQQLTHNLKNAEEFIVTQTERQNALTHNLKTAEEFIAILTEREKALERQIDSMVISHQQTTTKLEQQRQDARRLVQQAEIQHRKHAEAVNNIVKSYNSRIDSLNDTLAELTLNQAVLKRNIQLLQQSLETEIIAKRAEETIWQKNLEDRQARLRELSQQNQQLKAAAKEQEAQSHSADNQSPLSLTLSQSLKIGESLRLGTSANGQKAQRANEEQLAALHIQIGQLQHNEYVLREEIANMAAQISNKQETVQQYTQVVEQYNKLAQERIALFQRLAFLQQFSQTAQKQNDHLKQQLERTDHIDNIINNCNEKLAQMESYIRNQEKLFKEQIQYLNLQKADEHKTLEQKLNHSLQRQLQNKNEADFFKNKLEEAETYLMQLENGRRKTPFEANVTDFLISNQNSALKQEIWKLNHQIAEKDYQNSQLQEQAKSLQIKTEESDRQIHIIKQQKAAIQQKYSQISHSLEETIATLNHKITEFKNQISPAKSSSSSILAKIRDLQQLVNRVTKQANYFKTKLKEAQEFIDRLEQPKPSATQAIDSPAQEQEQPTHSQLQIQSLKVEIQSLKTTMLQLDQQLKERYEQISRHEQNYHALQLQLSQTDNQLNNEQENSRLAGKEVAQAMQRLQAATEEVIFLQNKLGEAEDYIAYLEKNNAEQTTSLQTSNNAIIEELERQNHNLLSALSERETVISERETAISQLQQEQSHSAITLQQNQQLIKQLQHSINQYNRKIKQLDHQVTDLDRKKQKHQAELVTLRERNILIEKISNIDREQLIQMETQITTISANHKSLEQQTAAAQQIVEKLQIEVDFFKQKLEQAEKYIGQVQNQKINDSIFFQAKLEQAERASLQLENQIKTIEQVNKRIVSQNEQRVKELNQQQAQIHQSWENTKVSLVNLQQITQHLRTDKQSLQSQLKETEAKTDKLESDRQQNAQRANYLQDLLTENAKKMAALQNKLREAESYIDSLQQQRHALLQNANQKTKESQITINQSEVSSSLKQQKDTFEQLIKQKEEVIRSLQTSLSKKDTKTSPHSKAQFFKDKLAEAEDYISQMQQQNAEVNNAILYLQQSSMKLKEEIAKLNEKLITSDGDKQLLMIENLDLQAEIAELVLKNQQLDRTIAQLKIDSQRELQLAKNEAAVLKVRADAELANYNNNAIIQQLQHKIESISQHTERLQTETTHLKQQLAISQSKIHQRDSLTHSLNLSLTLKESSIAQQETQMEFFKEKLFEAEEYITGLQQEKEDLKLQIQSLTSNMSSLANQIKQLNDKIVTSDRNSISLLSEIQEKSYENEALRRQLSNLSQSRQLQTTQQISNLKQLIIQLQRQLQYERESHKNDIDYLTTELNQTQGLKQQIQMDKQLAEEHLAGLEILLQEIKKKTSQSRLQTITEVEQEESSEFFKEKLKDAEEYIAELQKENDTIRLAIEQLHNRVASLSMEVARLNDKLIVTALDNELLVKQLHELKEEDERQREHNRQRVTTMQQMIDRLQSELEQINLSKDKQEDTLTQLRNEGTEGRDKNSQKQIDYILSEQIIPNQAHATPGSQNSSEALEAKLQQAQNYILELEEQKQNITHAFGALNRQTERLRQEINQLKERVGTTDADNLSLTQAGQQMRRQNEQLKIKLNLKQREETEWLEEATQYRRRQDTLVEQLQSEKTSLLQQNQNYQHILRDYQHAQQNFEDRQTRQKHSHSRLQEDLQQLTRDNQQLQTQLQEAIRKADTNENRSAQYSSHQRLQYPPNHITDLENERLSLISENEDLKNSVNMLISEMVDLQQQTDKLHMLNESLKPEIDSLRNDKELMESDLAQLHFKLAYLESLQQIKDQQISQLKSMNEMSRQLGESRTDKTPIDKLLDSRSLNNEEGSIEPQLNEQQSHLLLQKQAQIQSLIQELERKQEENRQMKVENLNLQVQLHGSLTNSQNASDNQSVQQQRHQTEIERLQNQINGLNNDKTMLELQVSRLQSQYAEMEVEMANKQTNIQSLEVMLHLANTNQKQNELKQNQFDELAIENQKLAWKVRELEEKLAEDEQHRLQLLHKLQTTDQQVSHMIQTEEQLENELEQLTENTEILQQKLEHSQQRIHELEEDVQRERKIETEIRKVINFTNNFSQVLDEETILHSLEPYPCLHELFNCVFYKLRLSSAITLQKQLKLQTLNQSQSRLRTPSESKSFRSSASRRSELHHELAQYEALNRELQQKLQTMTLDFNIQGDMLRQYERQIDSSKSQLEQESLDKAHKPEPADNSSSVNTKDFAHLQLLTSCLDKIIDLEQALEQIKREITQMSANERINISQQSQDSSDSNLIGRLQELEDRLTRQKTTPREQRQQSHLLDIRLTDLLKQLTANPDLPPPMRTQIDRYLTQLEEQITKEHDRHPTVNQPRQAHSITESHKQSQREEGLQNQSEQRNPNDLLREITGLNHAVEIYHAQSYRRRQHYRSTIEGMLLLSDELRLLYDQITRENGQQPITEVCQSMDELGKLIRNALQNVEEDQKSGEIQLQAGKDSIISGNYTHMLEINRQKQGKPGFDALIRLQDSLGEYLERNLENREMQTDQNPQFYRNTALTHNQIVQAIDARRKWYYQNPTQLSDEVFNHLADLLLFVQGDDYFYNCIDSLFSALHKIEQGFENALQKKNQVYRIHNERMTKILNPSEPEEEQLTEFEYRQMDAQQPTTQQQSRPQSPDSESARPT